MMDQSQTPATTSAGAIPDLVKIKPMQTDQTIDVQTSILEPIVANESFIKFQFDNKGILHSNYKIQLCLVGGDDRFLPFANGIGAVIRRCCLYAGSKIIAEVDDWNHYIYLGESSVDFMITAQRTITDITTSLHLPDGSYAAVNDRNAVIYRIVKPNVAPTSILQSFLPAKKT